MTPRSGVSVDDDEVDGVGDKVGGIGDKPPVSTSPLARPNTNLHHDVFNPTSSPTHFGSMQTQLHAWHNLLNGYPDLQFVHQVTGMIQFGCLLGYDGPLCNTSHHTPNLPIDKAGHAHLHCKIAARLKEGHLSIIQPNQPLSLIDYVHSNPGCLLWKRDLEDTFCHVVTAKVDASLLGFHYGNVRYQENALTFGGSSSPFLFNLVVEALHWVVTSCLPAAWPLNHYLDDTFGAVPAEVHDLSLLPVHVLALAAAALGLHLSAKKTFAGLTHLEVLSIEINSVAQTVGITED
ncbi:hypothetical protein NDA15_005987 [Ustilago hordei]|nr:hypothetical protein NDA15_005987 [Ustilago hordei]